MNWIHVPKTPGDFRITFSPDEIKNVSFLEAAELTAIAISNKYGHNLRLCLSGGLDSEFVLRTFRKVNRYVQPVILKSEFNEEESALAINLCIELGIEPRIIEFDTAAFLATHLVALRNNNLNVLLGATPFVVQKICGGVVLTGYGDPTPYPYIGTAKTVMIPEWDFYTSRLGLNHPGPFFAYDPTIFSAYVRDIDKDLPIQEAKCKLYGLPYREKIRYTPGFYSIQAQLVMTGKNIVQIEADWLLALLRPGVSFTL